MFFSIDNSKCNNDSIKANSESKIAMIVSVSVIIPAVIILLVVLAIIKRKAIKRELTKLRSRTHSVDLNEVKIELATRKEKELSTGKERKLTFKSKEVTRNLGVSKDVWRKSLDVVNELKIRKKDSLDLSEEVLSEKVSSEEDMDISPSEKVSSEKVLSKEDVDISSSEKVSSEKVSSEENVDISSSEDISN